MASQKRDIGLEILKGIREIKRGKVGRVTSVPSFSSIREKTGLSQAEFARSIGVAVGTLRGWEQGRRTPNGPARVLLALIAKRPSIVIEELRSRR